MKFTENKPKIANFKIYVVIQFECFLNQKENKNNLVYRIKNYVFVLKNI